MQIQLITKENENKVNDNTGNSAAVFQAIIMDGDYAGIEVVIGITHGYLERQNLLEFIDEMAQTKCIVHTSRPYTNTYRGESFDIDPEENVLNVATGVWGMVTLNSRDIEKIERNETFKAITLDYRTTRGAKVIVEENKQRKLASAMTSNGNKRSRKPARSNSADPAIPAENQQDDNTDDIEMS